MPECEFDGVIIGAGHNALVMAGYLAKSGLKVALIERRNVVGGGCSTVQSSFFPGFLHEYHSTFHRNIPNNPWYKDLGLDAYGIQYIYPQVNNGMPLSNKKCLIIHADPNVTKKSIERISKKDARVYYDIYHKYQDMGRKVWFVRDYSPPIPPEEEQELLKKSKMGRAFLEINQNSAYDMVHQLFEDEQLRAFYLFLFGVRGYMPSSVVKNTGFAIVAMTFLGNKAMLARGGSSSLTNCLAAMVISNGGRIFLSSEVSRIIVHDGRATGVETTDGRKFEARKFVVSGVDPTQTFLRFIGKDHLDKKIVSKVEGYKYGVSGRSFGVLFAAHAASNQPPNYESAQWDPLINQSFNTCVGYESPAQVVKHLEQAANGNVPDEIGIQTSCPTLFDPSRAPSGKHVLLAWQFVPYNVNGKGPEEWDKLRYDYLDKIYAKWGEYAPNISLKSGNLLYTFPETPIDTERNLINMREGDFHVGALVPSQLGYNRPFPEVSSYKCEIKNLYFTGAGWHPGGNITGAPGYNTARIIMENLGLKVWWNPPDPRRDWAELD
ncbi:MAG: NAD(P)/FAD-dependent oxidoreductase [Nitrososphaerota archaeon]|nr:NAD(P)/FAD-dependent oxidoreductase [Nitrososphaerota archaeon]MDG6923498.1 NAD(P)/FAD-dependent oxidoreductase [Nitrososphaerota archaeon]